MTQPKNIWEVCGKLESYKSTDFNGKDWTLESNNAWSNFPWNQLSDVQRKYIKTIWNDYNNQGNSDSRDAGKFIFFDLINLAPTNGENYGYQTKSIQGNLKKYLVHIPTQKKDGKPYLSSGEFKQLSSHLLNKAGLQSTDEFHNLIKSNRYIDTREGRVATPKIDEDEMKFPAESEFKLTWLREMVERGVEGVMGPFVSTGKKTNDGRFIYNINQSSLDTFIKYRDDYKEALWQDWLVKNDYRNLPADEKKKFLNSPYPKISETYLRLLTEGKKLSDIPNTKKELFVMTEAISGQFTSRLTANEDPFSMVAFGADDKTPISKDGVMAKVKENYIVDGWIELSLYPGKQLPWPFVWHLIGRDGIWQKSEWEANGRGRYMPGGISVVEKSDMQVDRLNKNWVKQYIPITDGRTKPTSAYLSYDHRIRYWHHRYSTKTIPDRELLFLIRYKNGAAGAVGQRYVSQGVPLTLRFGDASDDLSAIRQCGGIPSEGVFFERKQGTTTVSIKYLPYASRDILNKSFTFLKLRSRYICQIQDVVGWNRFTPTGGDYVEPNPNGTDKGTPLKGDLLELVDYKTRSQGYYSFTGGTSDRDPISGGDDLTDNYSVYEYKRNFKLDVNKNHISLWRLFNLDEKTDTRIIDDPNERFITPDMLLTDMSIYKRGVTNYNVKDIVTIYHSHAKGYNFNYKDTFSPGILTDKEIQFLYELVSFVYYGKRTDQITGMSYESIFDTRVIMNNFHRWKELQLINGFQIYDPRQLLTDATYLMDYISWAAPTNEQFFKKKYSEIKDTFVYRYNLKKSNIDTTDFYRVHAFAKNIYESERSKIPTVPAWVHYKYISRLSNSGENGIGQELDNDDVYRVFGGKFPFDRDVEQGKLIALPTFVLGGRPDVDGDEPWDKEWGTNPFRLIDKKLVVGNLDDVLDNWAKGKLHNGKYVSSMEILFWIRYKRGIASAPTQRTIKYFIDENNTTGINYSSVINDKNYWPKEAFVYNDAPSRETGNILPTETLHNIPILTSYYHPIYSDGGGDGGVILKNADPLLDIQTEPKLKDNKFTAYTGWNSKYVAHWSGAPEVSDFYLNQTSVLGHLTSTYPGFITKLNQFHTKPFKIVYDLYLSRAQSKNTKGELIYGFDSSKTINTSDVQAWFRALKIIQIQDAYVKYIEDGIGKEEGTPGSVIPVKANVDGQETIVFISGDPIGTTVDFKTEPFTTENLKAKPWIYEFHNQPEIDALNDDYSLGTKNCIPQYRYMRHIIQAIDFMYFFPKTTGTNGNKGWYSSEQSFKTFDWMTKFIPTKSTVAGLGEILSNEKQSLTKKDLRLFVLISCVSTKIAKQIVKETSKNDLSSASEKTINFFYKQSSNLRYIWSLKGVWTATALVTKVSAIGKDYFRAIEAEAITARHQVLSDFFKYKVDTPLFWIKYVTGQILYITQGAPIQSLAFGIQQYGLKIIGDFFKDEVVKHAFQEEVAKLVEKDQLVAALRLARLGSLATFGVTMLAELVSWQIGLFIENYTEEQKIKEMWRLLNEATKNGWVEGPYMESKGAVRIKKANDGTIQGQFEPEELKNFGIKIDKIPSQEITGNGFFNRPVPDSTDTTVLNEFITKSNEKFYKPGGLADTIGKNLKENSCECKFLTDLFADTSTFKNDSTDKGTPYQRKNWKTGLFRRQFRNRETIIDNAPTYSDIPIQFARAERPSYITKWFVADGKSLQVSDFQQPGGWLGGVGIKGRSTNIRLNGQGGTVTVNMSDCPRFWWPNILHIPVDDDLCSYMAMDGMYPTRMPEIYSLCDGPFKSNLMSKIIQERNQKPNSYTYNDSELTRYARSIPHFGVINYQDVQSYSNDPRGRLHIEYKNDQDNNYKVWNGNTIITMQGVDGIAPPHEREIVRLFRMKYGIDVVNPNNNCCSIGEVLDENPSENDKQQLKNRQDDATNCSYIIKLNDPRFHKIVKNACIKNKTTDNSQEEVEKKLAENTTNGFRQADVTVIDQNVISGSLQPSPDTSLIAGGWSDNKRRKKARRKNPCVPGCVDCCDDDRPIPPGVEINSRQIALQNADTTFANTPSADLVRGKNVGSLVGNTLGSVFGGIVTYIIPDSEPDIREPAATPLSPADSEKVKEYKTRKNQTREIAGSSEAQTYPGEKITPPQSGTTPGGG